MELRWRCGDGEWIIVEAWARDLSHEPSVGGLVINLHDVTAQRMSERALRQLSGRLLRLQDEERRRISGDLHDGTAQDLLAIGFNLDRLRRQAATQHADLETQINDSESLVQKALRDIRTLSYLLHPPLLDEMGLPAALRWLVDGFTARSGIDVTYVEDPSTGRMPRDIEIALFRIAQESLTNVHRHSGSPSAVVRLSLGAEGAVLVVKDRGKGNVTDTLTGGDGQAAETGTLGVGIAGMRERIRQLGGTLTVLSDKRGTSVEAWVPMAPSAP
jgi:signal transduction histidine kinase